MKIPSAILALILFVTSGCVSSSSIRMDTAGVQVIPPEYRTEIDAAYWTAAAALERLGYAPQHRVQRVEIVTENLVVGPSGKWGFSTASSPTGIAGGEASASKIRLAAPAGRIYGGEAAHEWGHAILFANGVWGTIEEQHKILRKAGL